MIDQKTRPIEQEDKRRLTEYLIDRVVEGISGRDGADLLDLQPSRTLFAGVLEAPRQRDIDAAHGGQATGRPPAGSALGLDFRVRPDDGVEALQLTIRPRWSHYYAVFPDWRQAANANQVASTSSTTADLDAAAAAAAAAEAALSETSDDGFEAGADEADEADTAEDEQRAQEHGKAILPRVWRRRDVEPDAVTASVPLGARFRSSVGDEVLRRAVVDARAAAAADPDAWRHLDEAAKRGRILGEMSVLASADAYAKALKSVAGHPAPLPAWAADLRIDAVADASDPGVVRVRVLLSNATPERESGVEDTALEERALFDAALTVEVSGGRIVPFEFLLAPRDYRSQPEMIAKGVNCVAEAEDESASTLRTQTLPVFRQPWYRTKDHLEVQFDRLAEGDVAAELERLRGEMTAYLNEWDGFLKREGKTRFDQSAWDACKADRDAFAAEVEGFALGIESLRRDAKLLDAFRIMNRAFLRVGKKTGGRIKAWRLFQIGFIVSQLPALAVRELAPTQQDEHATALRERLNEVGVLWFPTGGGKTEGFLGLIATSLAYDRLRGKTHGVSAWMRFPLRMLSLQQMERLARVIAVMNELRAEDARLNVGDPFAIGYYVGAGNTPNSVTQDNMRDYQMKADLRETVKLLPRCPFCDAAVEVKPLEDVWRIAHVCTNADCFSNTSDVLGPFKGSLPVCVVDNEIYRYLPSVLVGTVDKLAIVGFNRYFAHIVRGVRQRCRKHGYTSYDECVERWAGCDAKAKDLSTLPPIRDPGPSLLLQDELHLLRDELGVFNGHYEGLLRYLGAKAYLPPKVVAATATIEAYDAHAFHVYLSRSRRFPQPAWQQGESFYATSTPLRHRRFYVGVLGHTRAIEEAALRLMVLYQREVRRLVAAPRTAASAMGRDDVGDDLVLDTLRLYDLSLTYVGRKSVGGSIIDKVQQIERVLAQDGLPADVHAHFLNGEQGMEEVRAAIDRIERERGQTADPRLDLLVATNMISHGVDLERINMMAVCGMPSHYAEYVQSTSRAARSHPGVVFVCVRARDPREVSQFEFFPAMHEHMDRLIEAVAVNRFASFAPKKTVPGLLTGLLLSCYTPDLFAKKQTNRTLDHVPTLKIALGLQPGNASVKQGTVDQNEVLTAIEEIIGVDRDRPPASPAQITNAKTQVGNAFADQMGLIGRAFENRLQEVVDPLSSFRDVDEGIEFVSGDSSSASYVTRLRAR